uniref:Dpy-19 like C-mannosyltransferase 3 n=1 Tax=Taeniopygia guttata TaxID=59729 RepID=A0A674HIT3_TAEGU
MTTIRQRRVGKGTEAAEDQPSEETNVKPDGKILPDPPGGKVWNILSITVGGIVAISLGLLTSVYVATLHENDLWFSNIKVIIIFLVSSVVLWSVNMSIS